MPLTTRSQWDPLRRWTLILGAAHVETHPDTVQLSSQGAVVTVLVHTADLVVAGDLVLYCFSQSLRNLLAGRGLEMALRGTPTSVAKTLTEMVGLAAVVLRLYEQHAVCCGRKDIIRTTK
ncbi:hypothetical protein MMPV_007372 [Pyropia vietnamensis]